MGKVGQKTEIVRVDAEHAEGIAKQLLDAGNPVNSISGEEIRWFGPDRAEDWFKRVSDELESYEVFPDGESYIVKKLVIEIPIKLHEKKMLKFAVSNPEIFKYGSNISGILNIARNYADDKFRELISLSNKISAEGVAINDTVDAKLIDLSEKYDNAVRILLIEGGVLAFGIPNGHHSTVHIFYRELVEGDEDDLSRKYDNLRFVVTSELPSAVLRQLPSKTTRTQEHEREASGYLIKLFDSGRIHTRADAHTQLMRKFPELSERGFLQIWREIAPTEFKQPGRKPSKKSME